MGGMFVENPEVEHEITDDYIGIWLNHRRKDALVCSLCLLLACECSIALFLPEKTYHISYRYRYQQPSWSLLLPSLLFWLALPPPLLPLSQLLIAMLELWVLVFERTEMIGDNATFAKKKNNENPFQLLREAVTLLLVNFDLQLFLTRFTV